MLLYSLLTGIQLSVLHPEHAGHTDAAAAADVQCVGFKSRRSSGHFNAATSARPRGATIGF